MLMIGIVVAVLLLLAIIIIVIALLVVKNNQKGAKSVSPNQSSAHLHGNYGDTGWGDMATVVCKKLNK